MFGPRKKILKFKVFRLLENAFKSWIVLLISLCTQCTCTWHLLNLGLVRTLASRTGCTWHLTKGLFALALDFWRVLHSRSRANVPWNANWAEWGLGNLIVGAHKEHIKRFLPRPWINEEANFSNFEGIFKVLSLRRVFAESWIKSYKGSSNISSGRHLAGEFLLASMLDQVRILSPSLFHFFLMLFHFCLQLANREEWIASQFLYIYG